MAKLYFYYSAMNAGKSTILLQSAYNYKERGMDTLLFTPAFDNRYDLGKIASRIGLQSDAIQFDTQFNFYDYVQDALQEKETIQCILVDEAQFLKKEQVEQLAHITVHLKRPVLTYGLRTDFLGEPFEGSQYLLAWAEELTEIKTICHCGSKATMNLRIDQDGNPLTAGEQVEIGGNDRYIAVCRKHHFRSSKQKEKTMKRAFILMLDSFGVGALPDAEQFGDQGANTLLHIAELCAAGKADQAAVRQGALSLPNMTRLGLNAAAKICHNQSIPGLNNDVAVTGLYGCAQELSNGKDTPSGHWEVTGAPVLFDWGYFPPEYPSFPEELVAAFIKETGVPGILGNRHASGTEIIAELGDEHVRTGKPIVYTSADSVFQIAVHEDTFGLERLYEICKITRKLVDQYNIGRVIARPFVGESGNYHRTGHRHDYSVPPHQETLLDRLVAANGTVVGIGKIPDIFAHRGISKEVPADGNMAIFDALLQETREAGDRTLVFPNFVDFDMKFGHRRDVAGYAHALEAFDRRLPEFEALMQPGDIAIITADHGCDPTFKGTDHTREYIPIVAFGPDIQPRSIGCRESYADIGQTLAAYFGLSPFEYGESFL